MKHLREELRFNTPHRRDYVNITDQIEDLVRKSGVKNGLVLVNAMHITASVFVNVNVNDDDDDDDDDKSGLTRRLKEVAGAVRSTCTRSTRTTDLARTMPMHI